MEWHDIQDQLPPPEQIVVCVWTGRDPIDADYACAYWLDGDWFDASGGDWIPLNPPTAWAELELEWLIALQNPRRPGFGLFYANGLGGFDLCLDHRGDGNSLHQVGPLAHLTIARARRIQQRRRDRRNRKTKTHHQNGFLHVF